MAKEGPILFGGEMVKAILRGNKTKTRRVVKPQPLTIHKYGVFHGDEKHFMAHCQYEDSPTDRWLRCPYGKPGDTLWVRESWRVVAWSEDGICVDYRADNYCRKEWLKVPDEEMFERLWVNSTDDAVKAGLEPDESGMYRWQPGQAPTRWRPAIFLPRWASRINLRITDIRVERLQEITEDDAKAEGVGAWHDTIHGTVYRPEFHMLWDRINGKRSTWASNPWVWVIGFERVSNGQAKEV